MSPRRRTPSTLQVQRWMKPSKTNNAPLPKPCRKAKPCQRKAKFDWTLKLFHRLSQVHWNQVAATKRLAPQVQGSKQSVDLQTWR